MADVKRYSLYVGDDYNSRMVEMKYGAYVEYDDYMALETEHNALIDKVDLWRDEFQRIKVLAKDPEIIGLCGRALADIEQAVPVVVRYETLEKENAHLRQELAHYKQIAELATEGLADAVRRGE
jgi:hypothetical protein